MRYIKIASAKNPDTDFIELNDFNGFLCTQFQTLGISRNVEFLAIRNRNVPVNNKPVFKKYSLVIEILTRYSEYENKYYSLMTFLDRNKKDGVRLYYTPYTDMEERYCLCSIESSTKTEKRQPIVLNLTQNSLWMGSQKIVTSSQSSEDEGNIFAFGNDNGYYSAGFKIDEDVADYYSVSFYAGTKQVANISINGYNEVPVNIVVYGECRNPKVFLYRKNESEPFKSLEVLETIDEDHYLEINSNILESGVWEVNENTGARRDLTELVNYEHGSPYLYLDHGEYYAVVSDDGNNECIANISWREEYSE